MQVQRERPEDDLLVGAASRILDELYSCLLDEPVAIILSNEDGVILKRMTDDTSLTRALNSVMLTPGANYSEESVGTNGFGMALANNRAGLVFGAEHYKVVLQEYVCAGVPVHEPFSGRVLGALSLTTWSEKRSDLLIALTVQTVINIESRLARVSANQRRPEVPPGQYTQKEGYGYQPSIAAHRLTRLESAEYEVIVTAMHRADGSVDVAATDLGTSRATLYRKLKYYGIRA